MPGEGGAEGSAHHPRPAETACCRAQRIPCFTALQSSCDFHLNFTIRNITLCLVLCSPALGGSAAGTRDAPHLRHNEHGAQAGLWGSCCPTGAGHPKGCGTAPTKPKKCPGGAPCPSDSLVISGVPHHHSGRPREQPAGTQGRSSLQRPPEQRLQGRQGARRRAGEELPWPWTPDPIPQGPGVGSARPGAGAGGVRAWAAPAAGGHGCQEERCSLFFCTSALSILHSTFAVNHFLFRLTAEGL